MYDGSLHFVDQTLTPKLSKCFSIFLAFQTVRKSANVNFCIPCWGKTPAEISEAVTVAIPQSADNQRVLILIDSLTPLASLSVASSTQSLNLTAYLSSLLAPPRSSPTTQVSVLAIYHTDIPIPNSSTSYSPSPLALLTYLATTILTVHSLPNLLAEKAARDRSLVPPVFGLAEEVEGVLVGLKRNTRTIAPADRGIVIEMEHRRKSGRGVHEWYFLPSLPRSRGRQPPQPLRETVTLLDDHPLFKEIHDEKVMSDQELAGMTFELGLTKRQREDREGVVLPYHDAQKAAAAGVGGPGEGGRILYDMGVEDDFDEEEDEI